MGKGKKGNNHRNFFEKTLIRPLNRAYRKINEYGMDKKKNGE